MLLFTRRSATLEISCLLISLEEGFCGGGLSRLGSWLLRMVGRIGPAGPSAPEACFIVSAWACAASMGVCWQLLFCATMPSPPASTAGSAWASFSLAVAGCLFVAQRRSHRTTMQAYTAVAVPQHQRCGSATCNALLCLKSLPLMSQLHSIFNSMRVCVCLSLSLSDYSRCMLIVGMR